MERAQSWAEIRYSYPLTWEHDASLPDLDSPAWLIAIDHNPFVAMLTWSLPRSKTPRRIALLVRGPFARACARAWTAKRYPTAQVQAFADDDRARAWLTAI